jgi:hypothetical protein
MNPRGVRSLMRWALTTALASLALWPAAATATTLDARSDHVALHAYRSYLQNLLSVRPAWYRADDAYVASISGQCPHVLGALKHARPGTFSVTAVIKFGAEAGGDLDAVAYPLAEPALAKLAATLDPLRWSGAGIRAAIRRFLAAEGSLLRVAPSDLCSDARALAASHARRAARATRQWVSQYAHHALIAAQDEATFTTILERFATPAESETLKEIGRLLSRWAATVVNRVTPEGQKLLGVLGI